MTTVGVCGGWGLNMDHSHNMAVYSVETGTFDLVSEISVV